MRTAADDEAKLHDSPPISPLSEEGLNQNDSIVVKTFISKQNLVKPF